jgi:DNA topoisomerase-1
MRTDSVNLAQEALDEIRAFVAQRYGGDQLPARVRRYRTKAKNAQEAHEAVRPTSVDWTPEDIRSHLSEAQYKLYELIWKRTVACQMKHATIDTVTVDLSCGDDSVFRVTGSTVAAPGFLALYEASDKEDMQGEPARSLPLMAVGESVAVKELRADQHFTEPPPRYTEASLVKSLEDYGIGRPSTYASIISTLLQREYVELDKKRFIPTDVGRIVNGFLTSHFANYVDYEFTARLEDKLDAISRGEKNWVPVMREFWESFETQVHDKEATVTRREASQARELGVDPKTGEPVVVRMGRFGPYVQIGSTDGEQKPRFIGLRPGQRIDAITLEEALELARLPRELGSDGEGLSLSVNIGRYGPYVRYGDKFISLAPEDDPYTITIERAKELIAEKRRADSKKEIKIFDQSHIKILNGPYGPYITDGKKNARVPKGRDPVTLSLEESEKLLAEASSTRRGRRRTHKADKD